MHKYNSSLPTAIAIAASLSILIPTLAFADTITVNSNTDLRTPSDGFCEFAEAIDQANQQTGVDITGGDCAAGGVGPNDIVFAIPAGAQTITASSDFPAISSEIHFDALTQDGSASCSPRNLYLTIDGAYATQKIFYFLSGSQNSTVKGFNLYGTNVAAIDIATDNITVTCNNIGTDLSGGSIASNPNSDNAIRFEGPASNNVIGGIGENDRNIISGSQNDGINFTGAGTDNNFILGNYIGTDVSGSYSIANSRGIFLYQSNSNTIGGYTAGQGNLISGNTYEGIIITDGDSNTMIGNYIGTDSTGLLGLGNNSNGINIFGDNNIVGTSAAGGRNIISANTYSGIYIPEGNSNIIQNNYIGITLNGTALGNGNGIGIGAGPNTRDNNVIGGNRLSGEGNVISGNNGTGVNINESNNTTIKGNIIGLDPTGSVQVGNTYDGLNIYNSTGHIIGSSVAGEGNIISGNYSGGIHFDNVTLSSIKGNYIGTDITGTTAVNNSYNGITLSNNSGNNTIGGAAANEGNLLSGNNGNGLEIQGGDSNVVQGNKIGTDVSGSYSIPNNFAGINISNGVSPILNTIIGGNRLSGEGNLISGNNQYGISTFDADNTTIKGNIIGLNSAGTSALSNIWHGISVNESSGLIVGGLTAGEGNIISGNNQTGLGISSNSDNFLVQGNYIGTDITGTVQIGNQQDGIITADLAGGTIGGNTVAARNIISGNGNTPFGASGMNIAQGTTNVTVQGNWIGVDASGNPMGNSGFGINLGAANCLVGGSNPGEGNVISANGTGGLVLVQDVPPLGPTSHDNIIRGNYIGTDTTGAVVPGYGNSILAGVIAAFGSYDNVIGGTGPTDGNIIAGNSGVGVLVIQIEPFGGLPPARISILGNSIYENGSIGIDETTDTNGDITPDENFGPNVNDPGDLDSGPNDYLNNPVIYGISAAGVGQAKIDYFLDVPAGNYRVEFFTNVAADPSNHGEGQTFNSSQTITHTGSGTEFFTRTIAANPNDYITATVTQDFGAGVYGATSEFSPTTVVSNSGVDFGDAPDATAGTAPGDYNTRSSDHGAYHVIDGILYLGSCVDADNGNLQNNPAEADDNAPTNPVTGGCVNNDDEDGVNFTSGIIEGLSSNVTVVNVGTGTLNAWIDFNKDGDFGDTGEQIFTNQALTAGSHNLSFLVPASISSGPSYARFRLSANTNVTPYDEALGGEVEDYAVTLQGTGTGGGGGGGGSGGGGGGGGGGGTTTFAKPAAEAEHPLNRTFGTCNRSATDLPFTDLGDHWAKFWIDYLYKKCVIDGKQSDLFAPEDSITRAEVTKIVVRLFDLGEAKYTNKFTDVHENDWFSKYVIQAANLKIVQGYKLRSGISQFRPNQSITRAEALKILLAAKQVKLGDLASTFPDVQPSDWFYDAVSFGVINGLIQGYSDPLGGPNFFAPNKEITRAEFSKIAVLTYQLTTKKLLNNGETVISDQTDESKVAEKTTAMPNLNPFLQGKSASNKP